MRSKLKTLFIFSALVILLTGCGVFDGDGNHSGTESSAGSDLDFYGVAAIGAPAAGYTVYLQSADGQLLQAVADGSGGYSINARNIQAPYLLWFELADGEKIYAVTFQDGVVNLNAITSALTRAAYALSGGEEEDITPASFSEDRFTAAQDALAEFMQPVLALYGVSHEGFNSVQMPDFIADGFGVDGILDDFDISYDETSEEIKIRIKGDGTDIGSLDIDGVRNNEENVDNIDETSLASVTASMVAKIASNITFTAIAGENTSANNVVTALNLFTTYKNGTTVTWTSSSEAVSADGTLSRQSTDITVILTATVGKEGYSSTKSISVLVKAADSNGGEQENPSGEDTYNMLGNNRSKDSVVFNLNLPTSLSDGTTINWASSDPEYIDTDGKLLKRPTISEGSKTVTITATVTKNSETTTETYTLTVPSAIPQRISHDTYIKEDGSLWQSGELARYKIGDNYYNHEHFTQEISGSYDWVSAASNTNYTIAVKSDGTLWGWGFNHEHQLSADDTEFIEAPIQIGTDSDWISVSVGNELNIAAALKADGTVWVWGSDDMNIIPSPDGEPTQIPVQELSAASDWVDVKVGFPYITGLKTDGTIWSWGVNYFGGFGTAASGDLTTTPVQESTHATDWTAIDAYAATAAVKKDGTLWFWGGTYMELLPSPDERTVSTRGGPSFYTIEAPMQEPSLANNWVKPFILAGIGGIKSDGTIWGFGSGQNCDMGNGLCENTLEMVQESTQSTDWVDIAALGLNIYALKSDGSLWGWGYNANNELGTGLGNLRIYEPTVYEKKSFVKFSAGNGGNSCGIEANGELWCKNRYEYANYKQVAGTWSDVVTDGYAIWGIKSNGTLWFWGLDYYGEFMGDAAYENYEEPVQIGTDTWQQIALQRTDGASEFMMGIQTDGTLWAMGRRAYYNGSAWMTAYTPTKLSNATWSKVVLGANRLAIKTDGTLWAWSSGTNTGLGGVTPASYPVQVGTDTWKDVSINRNMYAIGVKSDGKLYGWGSSYVSFLFDGGYNYNVPTAMPYADTDWEKVWVGSEYFAAQKSGGSLYTAGANNSYPSIMHGLGNDTNGINTLRKVAGAYNDIFFTYEMVYAIGTDGKNYIWGRADNIDYTEPNPIKLID
jgi:alpha-tubulin suppressor-like RCC1 family protein